MPVVVVLQFDGPRYVGISDGASFAVVDGALVVHSREGEILTAFAPGLWQLAHTNVVSVGDVQMAATEDGIPSLMGGAPITIREDLHDAPTER
jgi:hypothetical protein